MNAAVVSHIEVLHRLAQIKPGARLARDHAFVGIEIGVLEGDLAALVLAWFPNATWHLIDPWQPYTGDESDRARRGAAWWQACERRARHRIRKHPGAIIHKATSDLAANEIPDGTAHVVFVDGLHSQEQVHRDITNYWPKLTVGGIMGGDDLDACAGVRRALGDVGRPFAEGLGGTWWYAPKTDS